MRRNDRVETTDPSLDPFGNGYKFIRLKSGRKITFWDAVRDLEGAVSDIWRAFSRAAKLAADDWDYERLDDRLDQMEEWVAAMRQVLDERRAVRTRRERIALLRNTSGRTPEEAEAYRRKADELERKLGDAA